ncbi:hypothetical protein PR202_gb11699 [Eleusine coracana subsp. coracana]|uniref:Uncharacterized protein n=1 Tax=Eleusine coracana subsp. coracana TaxID=191504 RepID=A0AAV5ENZ6_ELECO|nr:hypothetical protein PR202_gb11699 [Eleusine coracana subsp. coracana]
MDLAPAIVTAVPLKIRQQRTVEQALMGRQWPTDIKAGLSLIGLYEYFHLWDALQEVELTTEQDRHIWKWDSSGTFSTKSAYQAFHNGAITFEPWLIKPFIMEPLLLNLGDVYEKPGLHPNEKSSSGSQSAIGVGLLIDWQEEVCRILPAVCFVTKQMRTCNTFSLIVYLQGNFGSKY